jgi:hypothetical protein
MPRKHDRFGSPFQYFARGASRSPRKKAASRDNWPAGMEGREANRLS